MISLISKFIAVFKLQNRQAWYHKYTALGMMATWGLRLLLTAILYAGIYKVIQKTSLKGITLPVAISSMGLYTLYSCFGGREIFRIINDEYISGVMEVWLNKPLPYIGLKIAECLGKNIPAISGMFMAGIILFLFSDIKSATDNIILRILCGIPLLIGGVIITYLIYSIIGLSAIWLQDARSVFMIHDKLIMILGGIYIPIGFFPNWFRLIGESIPAGTATLISQLFYPDFFDNLLRFYSLQIIWIFILFVSLVKLNKKADLYLTVNGG